MNEEILEPVRFSEGGELTPEQAAKKFLDSLSPDQISNIKTAYKAAIQQSLAQEQATLQLYENQMQAIAEEGKELWDREKEMEYRNPEKEVISKRRQELRAEQAGLKVKIRFQQNKVKARSTVGGELVEFTDAKGLEHKDIPSFRNVSTEMIAFNEETILIEPIPDYIPIIDEDEFRKKGYVFDAIRRTKDEYILSTNGYIETIKNYRIGGSDELDGTHPVDEKQGYVLVTLDQLVLINDYYFIRAKALNQKEADDKNLRTEQYYDSLPEARRASILNQPNYYSVLPATVKKKITKEAWDNSTLAEKESFYKPFKRTGVKRLSSRLEDTQMWASFHYMYERFIDPEAKSLPLSRIHEWIPKGLITEDSVKATKERFRGEHKIGHPEVFEYWHTFREYMKWKIKDIHVQREALSEVRKIALETSFGDSNTNDILLAQYGILVKRQNGSNIQLVEIEQIKNAWAKIQNLFGGIYNLAREQKLKISHTGDKYVFASKAAGMYVSNMRTIAVSGKYGVDQFSSILAHEVSHWIDNTLGTIDGKRYATDNYEGAAGRIAFLFRDNMNAQSDSDYTNATKECFARALEQYFAITTFGDEAMLVFSNKPLSAPTFYFAQEDYVSKKVFYEELAPMIKKFLSENLKEAETIIEVESIFNPVTITLPERNKIVLYEGDGIIINDLFNEWNNIKDEKELAIWQEKIKNAKFGTYGTIGLIETINKFNPKLNEVTKRNFYNDIESALDIPQNERTYKPNIVEIPAKVNSESTLSSGQGAGQSEDSLEQRIADNVYKKEGSSSIWKIKGNNYTYKSKKEAASVVEKEYQRDLYAKKQELAKQSTSFADVKEGDYVRVMTGDKMIDEGLVTFKYGKHYLNLDNDSSRKYNYGYSYYLIEKPKVEGIAFGEMKITKTNNEVGNIGEKEIKLEYKDGVAYANKDNVGDGDLLALSRIDVDGKNKGTGSEFLSRIENYAKDNGLNKVIAYPESKESKRFFEKNGYIEIDGVMEKQISYGETNKSDNKELKVEPSSISVGGDVEATTNALKKLNDDGELNKIFIEKVISIDDIAEESADGQKLSDAIINVKDGLKSQTKGKILVYYGSEGKYYIADGFHRVAEAKLNGDKSIKADVVYAKPKNIAEAYHKAKADGSNPELVKAVQQLLPTQAETKSTLSGVEKVKTETFIPARVQEVGSGVVKDENGKDLIVYHSTNQDFTEFDNSKKSMSGRLGMGHYFTNHEGTLNAYGSKRIAAKLKMKNPVIIDETKINDQQVKDFYNHVFDNGNNKYYSKERLESDIKNILLLPENDRFGRMNSDVQTLVKDNSEPFQYIGYDGVIDKSADEYVVYDKSQIEIQNPKAVEQMVLPKDVNEYTDKSRYNSEIKVGEKYYDSRYGDFYTIEKMTPFGDSDVTATLKYDKGKTIEEKGSYLLYHIDSKQHSLAKEETKKMEERPEQTRTEFFDLPIASTLDELDANVISILSRYSGRTMANIQVLSYLKEKGSLGKEYIAKYNLNTREEFDKWLTAKHAKARAGKGAERKASLAEGQEEINKIKAEAVIDTMFKMGLEQSADMDKKIAEYDAKQAAQQKATSEPTEKEQAIAQKLLDKIMKKFGGESKTKYHYIYDRITQKIAPDLLELVKTAKHPIDIHGKSQYELGDALMPLYLQVLGVNEDRTRIIIAMTHIYIQNGDSMKDPDMEIRLDTNMKTAEALSFYMDGLPNSYQHHVYITTDDGKEAVNLREKQDQNSFLNKWTTNIVNQGHKVKFKPMEEESIIPENTKSKDYKLIALSIFSDLESKAQLDNIVTQIEKTRKPFPIMLELLKSYIGKFGLNKTDMDEVLLLLWNEIKSSASQKLQQTSLAKETELESDLDSLREIVKEKSSKDLMHYYYVYRYDNDGKITYGWNQGTTALAHLKGLKDFHIDSIFSHGQIIQFGSQKEGIEIIERFKEEELGYDKKYSTPFSSQQKALEELKSDKTSVLSESDKKLMAAYPKPKPAMAKIIYEQVHKILERNPTSITDDERRVLELYEGKGSIKGLMDKGILHQYYTDYILTQKIWELAYKFGLPRDKEIKVLEPSVGTGRFFKFAPSKAELYAFDTDVENAQITKLLYPKAIIYQQEFETSMLEPPHYNRVSKKSWLPQFDIVVGNPPYGEYMGYYKSYVPKLFKRFEMLFIFLSLKLLKPKGILIFVVSQNFMNNGGMYNAMKQEILKMSTFEAAYRLPNGVFATTEVGTDIIVLRKK